MAFPPLLMIKLDKNLHLVIQFLYMNKRLPPAPPSEGEPTQIKNITNTTSHIITWKNTPSAKAPTPPPRQTNQTTGGETASPSRGDIDDNGEERKELGGEGHTPHTYKRGLMEKQLHHEEEGRRRRRSCDRGVALP